MSQFEFNAANVAPAGDYSPIPDGTYTAEIIESEKVSTKDGTGAFLKMVFRIVAPSHAGRQIIHRLNLWNKNTKAVEIAQQQMSAICHAVGIMQITDSQQLHGRPMNITVKVAGEYNEIKAFKPAGAVAAQPQQTAQPAAKKAPAWAQPKGDSEY